MPSQTVTLSQEMYNLLVSDYKKNTVLNKFCNERVAKLVKKAMKLSQIVLYSKQEGWDFWLRDRTVQDLAKTLQNGKRRNRKRVVAAAKPKRASGIKRARINHSILQIIQDGQIFSIDSLLQKLAKNENGKTLTEKQVRSWLLQHVAGAKNVATKYVKRLSPTTWRADTSAVKKVLEGKQATNA